MHQIKAKKFLGQHFLTDENIAGKIADSLSPEIGDVLEIGPGTGVLTKYLLQKNLSHFKAIEIDKEAVSFLLNHYPALAGSLVQGDFLKEDINALFKEQFAIIGNFPYNISAQIFFRVLEHREQVCQVVGMVQKEVAERIASKHGNKTYGILSVLLQAWYNIEYLFTVHENVFSPPPKVKSAVIRLERNNTLHLNCNERLFVQVVKTGFNQRRKTLHNALKPILNYNGVYSDKRAEQLSVDDFIKLTQNIENQLKII